MHSFRKTGRRLATATLVLSTVTGTLAAAPAFAAPAEGALAAGALTAGGLATETGAEQQGAFDLPDGATLRGSGPTGFLTSHQDPADGKTVYRWTRYEDGSVTTLPAGQGYAGGFRSDVVVGIDHNATGAVYTLYDMGSKGAAPVVIDASHLGLTSDFRFLAGSTVVTTPRRPDGNGGVHLLSSEDGRTVDRTVQGLPALATPLWYDLVAPGSLLIHYRHPDSIRARAALVDIASGAVVEDRDLAGAGSYQGDVALSATHLAWAETPAFGDDAALRVARRGQEASERIPLGTGRPLAVEFLGDWVAYGLTDYDTTTSPNPLHALAARSLKDGRTVKLLDLVSRVVSDGDDAILVQGGTIEHGEGLYRITAGAEGDPVVTLVARTGRPIVLELTGQNVPATADFSKAANPVLSWKFAATVNAVVQVELTHTASGKRWTTTTSMGDGGYAGVVWNGLFDDGTAARLGSYTWRMTARTGYGLGPLYDRSGTLTVVGPHAPHGFTNSSSPDLLVKAGGGLTAYDAKQALAARHGEVAPPKWVAGSGWDAYDRLVTPGSIAGAPNADLLGRDRYGVLWQHLGTGDPRKPFAPRTRVGAGWQTYRLITGGSDLTGDGRPDLVGVDTTGVAWLHKGTGDWAKPFAGRVKIGGGWGAYNLVTATGNLAGGPAGDLVARDKDGVLWLHLGKGDGTFAPRTRIGGGWNQFAVITAVGDADRDGRPDLVAKGRPGVDGDVLAFYRGSGQWATPFKYRVDFSLRDVPWNTGPTLY
ncbi:VCBS repeat-containing protein [Streptomyces sp. TLI_105]|uniref:FG-GAP repeat domain-containing protein n=1 Tax=Streptomyces sp. TLI_105 TaxID=1881019 RepID=UPI000897376E|nr:VCBS repeat-containing protein [Streptomyces sp. TLI_105]SEC79933.1 Repeat domain-containing protein [Streptomyces sp. TLI_105]